MATTANFPGDPETLTLNFDKASATLAAGTLTIRWLDGRVEEIGEASEGGGGADPMAFPFDWHRAQIAEFADAIRPDASRSRRAGARCNVHRLIDAILVSARDGKRVSVAQ